MRWITGTEKIARTTIHHPSILSQGIISFWVWIFLLKYILKDLFTLLLLLLFRPPELLILLWGETSLKSKIKNNSRISSKVSIILQIGIKEESKSCSYLTETNSREIRNYLWSFLPLSPGSSSMGMVREEKLKNFGEWLKPMVLLMVWIHWERFWMN